MDKHDLTGREGGAPTLVSLALFAIVFFSVLMVIGSAGALIEPARIALAAMPDTFKAGALAAIILGLMAIVRIANLLGFELTREGTE